MYHHTQWGQYSWYCHKFSLKTNCITASQLSQMVWARTQERGVSGEHTSPRILSGMCGAFKFPLPYLYNPPLPEPKDTSDFELSGWLPSGPGLLLYINCQKDCRKSNSKTRQTISSSQFYNLKPRTSRIWMLLISQKLSDSSLMTATPWGWEVAEPLTVPPILPKAQLQFPAVWRLMVACNSSSKISYTLSWHL